MRRCLVDASVLVAAFSQERETERALSLLLAEDTLCVTPLIVAETQIALIRKRKRGLLGGAEAQRARQALDAALASGELLLLTPPESVWSEAVTMADRVPVHLHTQDALHAASARLLQLHLLTFDDDLAQAAVAEGIPTIT